MPSESELYQAYQSKSVLVTGGAGFIGSHLVEALVRANANVRVLDNFSTGDRDNLASVLNKIELVVGDICDVDTCRSVAKDTEVIFHQAALVSVPESIRTPDLAYNVNMIGTSHIFDAAHQGSVRRVVYASSSAVYGDCANMPLVESQCGRLMSPYAIGKRSSELVAQYAYTMWGLTSVGLRYFNVYGARQRADSPYAAAIPIFVDMVRSGKAPRIYGDGSQTRDFVNVQDVVRANLHAGIAQGIDAAAVNIGTGVAITVTSLAELICEILASSQPPQYVAPRPGDIAHSVANTHSAERLLGFHANVELRTGLQGLLNTSSSRQT